MTVQEFLNELIVWAIGFGKKLLIAFAVLVIGRIVIKWTIKLLKSRRFAERNDKTTVTVLLHFVSAALYALLSVVIIAILGVPAASVIAVIASAGVAIGLALQGALGNIAGGIMILLFRPFRVGDFVEVAGRSGSVTDVGVFYTKLTMPDNKVAIIPNGTVMGDTVTNLSAQAMRRVDFAFGVAYGTDVERVKQILLEEAERHALALTDPAPFCRLSAWNECSMNFILRVWVRSDDYWKVNFDLMEAVTERFEKEGIGIPFPQLDVHVKSDR